VSLFLYLIFDTRIKIQESRQLLPLVLDFLLPFYGVIVFSDLIFDSRIKTASLLALDFLTLASFL